MDTTTKSLNQPLVSILMLTYNRAHFLPEAIDSVLKQTYSNWELTVIDDGSTDGTKELMVSYSESRIHYVRHEENQGLFVRRAESLQYATGLYTAVLDSDDIWTHTDKLAEQVSFMETHPEHVVVGTQASLINVSGLVHGSHSVKVTDDEIRRRLLIQNQFIHSSLLFRTEALKKTTGYRPTLAEDLELILQLGVFGKLANLTGFYTAHRVHSESQNDHGRKMARAVLGIIKKYPAYPHYYVGIIAAYLRLLRSFF